jgi:uncharacterized protein with NRDE domain
LPPSFGEGHGDPAGRPQPVPFSAVCLLVVLFHVDPDAPLVVAANRDERLDRPALAMTVLADRSPRILGGRDLAAGGTWLAVNDRGVVAGLTNRPLPDGRDPAKLSRGALPLVLAGHDSAQSAVEDFAARIRPGDYNPAWFLVGDRSSLYALDLTGSTDATVTALDPGIHILENAALGAPSPKVDLVRSLLGPPTALGGPGLVDRLAVVLADHSVPEVEPPPPPPDPGATPAPSRRPETRAACVHTEDYGTRSSTIISVTADGSRADVRYADGHPCTAPFLDATALWTNSP